MKEKKKSIVVTIIEEYKHPETGELGTIFSTPGADLIVVSNDELENGTYTKDQICQLLADQVDNGV